MEWNAANIHLLQDDLTFSQTWLFGYKMLSMRNKENNTFDKPTIY